MRIPDHDQAAHYLSCLRDARATALQDAEGFRELFQEIESFGRFLKNSKEAGLGRYRDVLREFVALSIPEAQASERFDSLFTLAVSARNDAVHEGAYARTITQHATDLASLLESTLMTFIKLAKHLMISHPITVASWQTLREARQLMLRHSFSFLPIEHDGSWKLLADFELVSYLGDGSKDSGKAKDAMLDTSLEDALDPKKTTHPLLLHTAKEVAPTTPIGDMPLTQGLPLLVVERGHLLGLIAPFDRL